MSEPTVRCYLCGKRFAEAAANRRRMYGAMRDLCFQCDSEYDPVREAPWWKTVAPSPLTIIMLVGAAAAAISYFLFSADPLRMFH